MTNAPATTNAEIDWKQSECLTSSHKQLFKNKFMSDVVFICTDQHGQKQRIPAHKILLGCRSKVFNAMFFGIFQEKTDEIEIVDIESEIFTELLRYLYYDEANITVDSALSIIYTAKKYFVPGLENKCVKYLVDNLSVENVCLVLSHVSQLIEDDIFGKCLEFLDQRVLEVLNQDNFYQLPQAVLHRIFERDTLAVGEFRLFQALDKWSRLQCKTVGVSETAENRREMMGPLLFDIRFPTMPKEIFASEISTSGVLTDNETIKVFQFFLSDQKPELSFPTTPRIRKRAEVSRFNSTDNVEGWYCQGPEDAVEFCADQDIFLQGIGIYGSCEQVNNCTYVTTIKLIGEDEKQLLSKTFKFSGQDKVFQGLVDDPLALHAGCWYCVAAKIIGPRSVCGVEGQTKVNCSGVKFEFRNTPRSKNHTEVARGQIASLIFHLR